MLFNNGFIIKVYFSRNKSELFWDQVSDDTKSTASLTKRRCIFGRKGMKYIN